MAQHHKFVNVNQLVANGCLSWSKPLPGFFTCNVDATVFSSSNKLGLGLVVRDSLGYLCGARSAAISWPMKDPSLFKELSLHEALSWLKQLLLCLILESGFLSHLCLFLMY